MNPAGRMAMMAMIMRRIGRNRDSHQMQHSLAHCGSQGIAPQPQADEGVVELSIDMKTLRENKLVSSVAS